MSQIKTAHFWLLLVGVSIGGAMEVGLIPNAGTAHKWAVLAMIVLNFLGVQQAAKWVPPTPGSSIPHLVPPDDAIAAEKAKQS